MDKDKKEKKEVEEPKADAGRKARWEEALDRYEKQNPEKFAAKKKAGEFDKIPATFL